MQHYATYKTTPANHQRVTEEATTAQLNLLIPIPVLPNHHFYFTTRIFAPIAAVPPDDWWPDYLEDPALRQQCFTPDTEDLVNPNVNTTVKFENMTKSFYHKNGY